MRPTDLGRSDEYTVFMNMKPYNIALLGCGTVGSGVARLLLSRRIGWRQGPGGGGSQDYSRPAPPQGTCLVLPPGLTRPICLRSSTILTFMAVAEVVGGTTWARHAVLDLLAAGKDVVTANKALLATHGPEIFDAGRQPHVLRQLHLIVGKSGKPRKNCTT